MEQEKTGLAVQEETSPALSAQGAPEDGEPKSEEEKKKDIKKKAIKEKGHQGGGGGGHLGKRAGGGPVFLP